MQKDKFLDKIVFGWIKKDLINISRVKTLAPDEDGNGNFPLALCTIVYMDFLGGYLLGKEKGIEKNIKEYLNCFKNPTDYYSELLCDLFRNGLGHDYFSRGGISRNNNRPPMMYIPEIGVVLDADTLLNDFLESLENFKLRLTDKNFKERFNEARECMEEKYLKHKSIIDSLPQPKSVDPKTTYAPRSFASNASGTAIYSLSEDILKQNETE